MASAETNRITPAIIMTNPLKISKCLRYWFIEQEGCHSTHCFNYTYLPQVKTSGEGWWACHAEASVMFHHFYSYLEEVRQGFDSP